MCKSLFVNLGGSGGGSIADGVLQTPTALTTSLQIVKDNLGNSSSQSLSTLSASFVGNTIGSGSAGLIFGGFSSSPYLGGIWPANVTPGGSNYSFLAGTSSVNINNSTTILFELGGTRNALLNSSGFAVGTGTITQNGAATFKGFGANILSLRDSSNVEKGSLSNTGALSVSSSLSAIDNITTTTGDIQASGVSAEIKFGSRIRLQGNADGILLIRNNAGAGFTRTMFGGTTSSFPALSFTNTPATITATDGAGTSIDFNAANFIGRNLTSGSLTTARPFRFGDKATITDAALTILGFNNQLAIEHNGTVYYIPVSTTQFS